MAFSLPAVNIYVNERGVREVDVPFMRVNNVIQDYEVLKHD